MIMNSVEGKYIYSISEYDNEDHEATHEIEVQWATGFTPPIVVPAGQVIVFEDDPPEDLAGTWRVIEIRHYVDHKGDGLSVLSYLVSRTH